MKLFNKNRTRYSLALFVSLFLHIGFLSFIFYKNLNSKHDQLNAGQTHGQKVNAVKLDNVKFITQKQLKEIKNARNKQIVANELNGKKEKPVESRFAGEVNQSFDRQTMALNNGAFKKAGIGNKLGDEVSKANNLEASSAAKKITKNKEIKNSKSKTLSLSELGVMAISNSEEKEMLEKQIADENVRLKSINKKNLSSLGVERGSSDSAGLARNNDFVEDVPLGDMTNLNTTEFKYYGFYHRIRQQLEQYWGSTIASKAKNLYKSGRRLPSSENLITAITVTLDSKGNILDIKIDGTSGIRELDQAAIESFNKAGPFPNPPKGLLVGGRAIIQWGFVVKS